MSEQTPIDPTLKAGLMASVSELRAQRRDALARAARELELADSLLRRINGALGFLGEPLDADTDAPKPPAADAPRTPATPLPNGRPSGRPGTWTAFFFDRLAGKQGGMSLREFLATVPGTEYAEKLAAGRNGFYNGLAKLVETGKLVRRGDVVYLPEIIAKIDAGEIVEPPREDTKAETRGAYILIERVVRSGPDIGMKAGEVVEVMKGMPEAQPYLRRNTQLVYATLNRMKQAGILEQNWQGYYRIPPDRAEAQTGVVVRLQDTTEGRALALVNRPRAPRPEDTGDVT